MGNIEERRERTENAEIENKAELAPKPEVAEERKDFPYKKVLIGILIVVAVIALALLIVNAVVDSYASEFKEVDIDNATIDVALVEKLPANVVAGYAYFEENLPKNEMYLKDGYMKAMENYANASSNIKAEEGVYTYAIFGATKNGETEVIGTIVLASLNANTKKVTYSVVSSTLLAYIGSYVDKTTNVEKTVVGPISDAYLFGGAPLLARAVQDNFGVDINGYAVISNETFAKMFDSFGGAELTINQETLDAMKALGADFGCTDLTLGEGGKVKLEGIQIVAYVKSCTDGKSTAISNVTSAMAKTALSSGVGGLTDVLNIAKESVDASIARDDFGTLVQLALGAAPAMNEDAMVMVGANSQAYTIGARVCDYEAERVALQNAIFGKAE